MGRFGGILGDLGSFGGLPGPSWKPSRASWTLWRAPGTCLGADRAPGRRGDSREWTPVAGWGSLRRLQKPYQAALGILARLNVPGATVADYNYPISPIPSRSVNAFFGRLLRIGLVVPQQGATRRRNEQPRLPTILQHRCTSPTTHKMAAPRCSRSFK